VSVKYIKIKINFNSRNSMAMSAIDSNVRGITDIISAVHMSQSTHADLNLASHINSNNESLLLFLLFLFN
jgi:hypothetical protein